MADEVVRALTPHAFDKDEPETLRMTDAELAREAIALAADMRSPRLMRPLLALINTSDQRTRNRAVQALGLIGDRTRCRRSSSCFPRPAMPGCSTTSHLRCSGSTSRRSPARFRRMASHKQAVLRMNAAFVLGDVRQTQGLPLLERMLADPSERVQLEAVLAIAKLAPNAEAVRLLEKATTSRNTGVRAVAIDAVGVHGNERSIPGLEQLLALSPPLAADDQERVIGAIYRLSKGKRADLVHDRLFMSTDPGVRRRAAILLGRANDPRVHDYLLSCFEAQQCPLPDVEGFLRADRDPRVPGRVLWIWMRGRDELLGLIGALRPPGASALVRSGLDVAIARRDWASAQGLASLLGDLQDPASRAPLQAAAGAGRRVVSRSRARRAGQAGRRRRSRHARRRAGRAAHRMAAAAGRRLAPRARAGGARAL